MAIELWNGKVPIIRRSLNDGFMRGTPDAEPSTGCIPRDFSIDPVAMRDSPSAMKLIDESEWDARYDEQMATESSLYHMYVRDGKPAFEFLDQDGFPDCWAHSTSHAMMLDRMKQNLPPIRFNAVALATMMGQTNGGWCGLSMKFARENGLPVIGNGPGEWPYQSRRGKDTPELRASMAKHKSDEDWYDLGSKEWEQDLSVPQMATCGFENWPVPRDYDDYSHSICGLWVVRIEKGSWKTGAWGALDLNSWKQFGYFGLCVIPFSTTIANNAVALRASTPSAT